jgi:Uma2 family endonuclease
MTQAAVITAKFCVEDYHRMIEAGILDDRHVELLNGQIVEIPSESIRHASYGDRTEDYIRKLLDSAAWLRVGKPITLNDSEPEPDVCICRNIRYDIHHPWTDDIFWLIEVSDENLIIDLQVKDKIYAAAGIQEYWVVNLRAMTLIVHRSPSPDGYQAEQTLTQGNVNPLAFPDVPVSVQRLLS